MKDISIWSNFFLATSGAAAALAGLVFVGVSISLSRILTHPKLSNWAVEALALLVSILNASLIGLIPRQSLRVFGFEIFILAILIEIIVIYLGVGLLKVSPQEFKKYQWRNFLFNQVVTLPYLIAAILLINGLLNGLYWLVSAFIFSFIKALVDAWVLLIEIHR